MAAVEKLRREVDLADASFRAAVVAGDATAARRAADRADEARAEIQKIEKAAAIVEELRPTIAEAVRAEYRKVMRTQKAKRRKRTSRSDKLALMSPDEWAERQAAERLKQARRIARANRAEQ